MNDFHIVTTTHIAPVIAAELRRDYHPDDFVAIRGEEINGDPEWVEYRIVEAPHDHVTNHAYTWTYVRVGDWLAAFNKRN